MYVYYTGNAGVLSGARPKAAQQVGSKGIQVFCDENQAPGSLQPQTGEWATIPSRPVTNKENEKKAGVWKNQKVLLRTSYKCVCQILLYLNQTV